MRRSLILLAVAISLMIALAFVVPLAFLVSDLASDRALSEGERRAQDIARVIATLAPARGIEVASIAVTTPDVSGFATSLILPDGSIVGAPLLPGETTTVAQAGTAFRTAADAGEIVYTPVIREDGSTVVVRVLVPEAAIREGVDRSWAVLAAVAVVLVVLGGLAAELLGRSIIRPVEALADSAARLGEGDLSVRLEPAGPHEIRDAGIEFNRLADRITRLLQHERETAADLSHRLRTPITALRLDLEGLDDTKGTQRVWDDLDILERTVDFLIRQAARTDQHDETSDLAAVLRERVEFWSPLAQEQERAIFVDVPAGSATVALAPHDTEALIDILFDNVFAHAPEPCPLSVTLTVLTTSARLVFEDGGPGFPSAEVLGRGTSGSASTGLGLHIVRSTIERVGGSLQVGESERLGGAKIVLQLDLVKG